MYKYLNVDVEISNIFENRRKKRCFNIDSCKFSELEKKKGKCTFNKEEYIQNT